YFNYQRCTLWWGDVPDEARPQAPSTGRYSNIALQDYVGAEKCGACHQDKYRTWSQHPHRWMNATAAPDHVRGDFDGQTILSYLGGSARFWREADQFIMRVERGAVKRQFRITRTIGSRYFQYYVGVQTEGPEPRDEPRYRVDHVLPFGYWLTKRQWVPTVHVSDGRVADSDDSLLNPYEGFYFAEYDRHCSQCHTTLPVGDWLLRMPD